MRRCRSTSAPCRTSPPAAGRSPSRRTARSRPAARSRCESSVLPATLKRTHNDPFVYLAGGPGGAATQSPQPWRASGSSCGRTATSCSSTSVAPAARTRWPARCRPARSRLRRSSPHTSRAAPRRSPAMPLSTGPRPRWTTSRRSARRSATASSTSTAISYGATAAQVFLRRHPGSVRTVVLDGATLLDVPFMSRFASNGQRALDLIAARCAAQSAVRPRLPHLAGRSPSAARAAPSGAGDGPGRRLADRSWTTSRSRATIQVDDEVGQRGGGPSRCSSRVQQRATTRCWRPTSPRRRRPTSASCRGRSCATSRGAAWIPSPSPTGTYLDRSVAASIANDQVVCAGFPKRAEPAAEWARVSSKAPALALVGGADPQDPIGNIAGLRDVMPNARIVVAPGMGHGVGAYGCLPHLVARLVALGSAKKLDLSCARRIAPRPFLLG